MAGGSLGRRVVAVTAVAFLVLFIPQAVQFLHYGSIAAVPATGRFMPGGNVLVTVRGYDGDSNATVAGCVQYSVEPGVGDGYGHGNPYFPSSGQICPMNDPSIRETEATVFLGHARGILEVRWGNNSERLDILVPRGRTLEVSVQVDEVTPGDRLGYAAHADLYVSDRLISSELRTRDILVSLQVLALMGCMVAALMRATWIAPIGLTVLAMLPQAYVNNFYLIDDISPWWFFTAGAVGVLHWRLWFVQ